MIKAASIGLGWWSDELAKSIQGKSKKKELIFQKNIKLIIMTLSWPYLKIPKLMQ